MPQAGVFDKQVFPRAAQGHGGAFNQSGVIPVAASQTIYAGDIVDLTSGTVQQAIALPGSNNTASLSGGSLSTLGIALDNITTNSSGVDTSNLLPKTTIPIALWDSNLEVLLRIWNATASNTPISNFTFGQNLQFARWRGPSASTWWYMASTTSTNGELEYCDQYGLLPYLQGQGGALGQQQSTDQYPLAWFRINQGDRLLGN